METKMEDRKTPQTESNWKRSLSQDFFFGVEEFQHRVAMWNMFNFPKKVEREDYNQPFKGMVEELGELAHADLKMEQGIRGNVEEHQLAAKDAVGDLLVYMADYCNMKGV